MSGPKPSTSLVTREANFVTRLVVTGFLALTVSGCSNSATAPTQPSAKSEAAVGELVVKFEIPGKEPPQITVKRDVATGTTLEDVMRSLSEPSIKISGSGFSAFVQSIDGVIPTADRGWTFTIDGEFAQVGIGSLKLTPPQTIVWQFKTFAEITATSKQADAQGNILSGQQE